MSFSYSKLWKLLTDNNMNKTELRLKTGIGTATLLKLSSNENVSLDVFESICQLLNSQPGDMMEYVPDQEGMLQ